MKNLVTFEWMFFGICRLTEAAQRRGARLHLLTANPGAYSFDIERSGSTGPVIHEVDIDDHEQVERVLASIGTIDGVIDPTERGVATALRVAGARGLPGQNPEAVRLVRDKPRFRRHLFDAGLSRGTSVLLEPDGVSWDEVVELVGAPFIVKDRAGSGSHDAWLARTPADLDLRRTSAKLFAEPYFTGPLFSAETISWQGETRLLGFSGRVMSPEPHFREEVFTFPVAFPLDQAKQLEERVRAVLESISYTSGFAHTEFILTDAGLEVVEINPRIPGGPCGENFSAVLESDLYEALVDMAMGNRPQLFHENVMSSGGIANVVLYPPHSGVFDRIDGQENLRDHAGSPVLHQIRKRNDPIDSVNDLWGAVAILSCDGPSAEIAMLNALSAARGLRTLMAGEQN